VVKQISNQTLTLGPTHEQKHVHMIFKGMFTRSEANSCSCKQSTKEFTIRDKTKPLSFQKVGLDNGQPRLTWLRHLVVPSRTRKC